MAGSKMLLLGGQGHLGKGAHVLDVVQEVETADHVVVLVDHLAREAHQVPGLGFVAQHIGGADEDLLARLGANLFHFSASLKG